MFNKELIAGIAGIDDWRAFEEFVKNLYSQHENSIEVIRSYKAQGASGRNREVDVLIRFGFNPHILSLGVECKFWSRKIDGDIIDVAAAKRDDLLLDKYAVITTVGFEAGAELYAKSKGIDLFLIRPSVDDDFGYTGRVVKVRLSIKGSNPTNVRIDARLVLPPGFETSGIEYANGKLSNIVIDPQGVGQDAELDLYRYSEYSGGRGVLYSRHNRVDNIARLIYATWLKYNSSFWEENSASINQKIVFSSPTAIFLRNGVLVLLNAIEFKMQFLITENEFEIDRGKQYPLVLENVIANAVTPLAASEVDGQTIFSMSQTEPKVVVDLATKPDDAVGRDGLSIALTMARPMGTPAVEPGTRTYELVFRDGEAIWEQWSNKE